MGDERLREIGGADVGTGDRGVGGGSLGLARGRAGPTCPGPTTARRRRPRPSSPFRERCACSLRPSRTSSPCVGSPIRDLATARTVRASESIGHFPACHCSVLSACRPVSSAHRARLDDAAPATFVILDDTGDATGYHPPMLRTEIDAILVEVLEHRRLLAHPFYRRWEAGTLDRRELAAYAAQYRHFEAALPGVLDAVVHDIDDPAARRSRPGQPRRRARRPRTAPRALRGLRPGRRRAEPTTRPRRLRPPWWICTRLLRTSRL